MSEYVPGLNDIPFPEYEGNEQKIIDMYLLYWKQVEEEILLLSELPDSMENQRLLKQRQATINRLTVLFYEMRKAMNAEIPAVITDAYLSGLSYTAITSGFVGYQLSQVNYKRALTQTKRQLKTEFAPSKQRYRDRMIRDLQTDLLKATRNTEESVKAIVRESFAKSMADGALKSQKRSAIASKVKQEITKRALKNKLSENVAIIDKMGRKWSLDRYVNMAVRTKVNNVYFDGIRQQAKDEGTDLAIINTNPGTKDACKTYEGMIISLNGETKGYQTYEQLKASKKIFHPNCRHFARPIPSLDLVPKSVLDKHKKQSRAAR